MRAVLAMGLLIALCAIAEAALRSAHINMSLFGQTRVAFVQTRV